MPKTLLADAVIDAPTVVGVDEILTERALQFIVSLHRQFETTRQKRLAARTEVQQKLDQGWLPNFPAETESIRSGTWRVRLAPQDLQDRRVEITGPVDRKMVINGLNSGASTYMADFEDSNTPTWANVIAGQINLRDAIAGTISFEDKARGKSYALNEKTAVLIVRPRGWHLNEAHVLVDGTPISASLFDFGLYVFHNAQALLAKGSGPYFYLPKMESRHEAALWCDVFLFAEKALGLSLGTIRATVLIETILAAFEMDEILHELRDHIVGLNCGRWDYIFSTIKKFRNRPAPFPDRAQVTMESPAMRAYSRLLITTCHKRGAHAMGGMAAQIPIKNDIAANDAAFAKVRADKEREVKDGHDGTWVAHPDLVKVALRVFNEYMPGANQIGRIEDHGITQQQLLEVPLGEITEAGLRANIRIGVQYVEAWLRGTGCVPINNLMEDAATAEISRAQIWQWLRHAAKLNDGRAVTTALVTDLMNDEMAKLRSAAPAGNKLDAAAAMFQDIAMANTFQDFLTLPAYEHVLADERNQP
ncbi:MAG: malate synthase A [Rhodospirillaceae bacterium]|nr:malate synthase A [Rhodospirillaceae bacterium]